MTDSNQFRYLHSDYLQQVTMLQAEIHDFSYDKHAHEELSIGVTRQGLQHVTSYVPGWHYTASVYRQL